MKECWCLKQKLYASNMFHLILTSLFDNIPPCLTWMLNYLNIINWFNQTAYRGCQICPKCKWFFWFSWMNEWFSTIFYFLALKLSPPSQWRWINFLISYTNVWRLAAICSSCTIEWHWCWKTFYSLHITIRNIKAFLSSKILPSI